MSQHFDELHVAAQHARYALLRVAAEEGILDQIARGEWDSRIGDEAAARDLSDTLRALGDHVASDRAAAGQGLGERALVASAGVAEMATTLLPFNRKERNFTGTVLPMIVASDGFAHVDRLLTLCGLPGAIVPGHDGDQPFQFFTEYSFGESIQPSDVQRFGHVTGKDAPDLVLVGADWLLCIEAKMYHSPTRESLENQLGVQRSLMDIWSSALGIPDERVRQVVLLRQSYAEEVGRFADVTTLTWEQVAAAYAPVAPAYWMAQLLYANSASHLMSKSAPYGTNKDGHLSGQDIVDGNVLDRVTGQPFVSMGRAGGLHGAALTDDIQSGAWASRRYEVALGQPPNSNWFLIADFLGQLPSAES